MNALLATILFLSACLAATGQLLFRYGAKGNVALLDYFNAAVIGGAFCYGFSTVLWVLALSRASLIFVYPFTILTFVLVYVGSAFILKEQWTLATVLGVFLMLSGLFIITRSAGVPT